MNKSLAILLVGIMAIACTDKEPETYIGRQTPEIKNRLMTPELLWAMGRVGGCDVSPDAQIIVYNVSYYSVEENKSHTVVYTINADGTEEKNLTESTKSESAAKWLEDKITYLSADDEGVTQLWMMNADGSGRKQLSSGDRDIEDYAFSPDGKQVLVIHTVKNPVQNFHPHADLPKSTGLVVDEQMFQHWDEYTDNIPHPYLYKFNGSELVSDPVDLLEGEPFESPLRPFGGIEQLAWSPDSKQILYTCRKKTGREYAVSTDSDIFLYDIESGKTTNLCKPADYQAPEYDYSKSLQQQAVNQQNTDGQDLNLGYDINPSFSPDGKYITWLSMERDGYESDINRLCVYEVATGKKTYVTESFESGVDDYCWASDSKSLYFIGVWHGITMVYSTNLDGEVKQLTDSQHDYTSVALCGDQLLCGRQSMKEAKEFFLVNPKDGKATQVTHENQYFVDNLDWGDVEPRWSKSVDGKDILSWIILPPNFDKTKKYPTLLFCEGGPQSPVSQFWSYRWNMQIMAANGYVVVAPNRRGLPGFGKEWLEEISTNYTGRCMDDYKSAIDDAVANLPYVDKDRLGCIGASFGGFSVYWLAGNHDGRFKCFIAHDGIYNLEQQYVETEEAWFTNWDLGGAPWHKDDPVIQRTYQNSPHKFVDKWDAPILCIHGQLDYRILFSQAIAAFNAARYRGVPAKLLLFPNENHWVLKPQNGILWQRTFFGWLDQWLKSGERRGESKE